MQVPVLDGWEVVGQGDADVLLGDGQNSFVYAVTGTVDPSTDAASVISASMDSILPKQTYTQLKKTDIAALESFGSVVSMAGLQYRATWTDQQASVPLQGLLICAVRQDGTAIIMTAEHAPPKEFEDSTNSWAPVINRPCADRPPDSWGEEVAPATVMRPRYWAPDLSLGLVTGPRPSSTSGGDDQGRGDGGDALAPAGEAEAVGGGGRDGHRAPRRPRERGLGLGAAWAEPRPVPITWTATLPIAKPAARTRRAVSASSAVPARRPTRGPRCRTARRGRRARRRRTARRTRREPRRRRRSDPPGPAPRRARPARPGAAARRRRAGARRRRCRRAGGSLHGRCHACVRRLRSRADHAGATMTG